MDSWPAIALPGLIVVLAVAGALRWDALRTWFLGFFTPPADTGVAPQEQHLEVPRHLHDSELRHQAPPTRPQAHRSGRRG